MRKIRRNSKSKVYTMFQYMNDLYKGKKVDQDGYVLGYLIDEEELSDEIKRFLATENFLSIGSAFKTVFFTFSAPDFIFEEAKDLIDFKDIYAFAIPIKEIATIPEVEEYLRSLNQEDLKSMHEDFRDIDETSVNYDLLKGRNSRSLYERGLSDSLDFMIMSENIEKLLKDCRFENQDSKVDLILNYMDFNCADEKSASVFEELKESYMVQVLIDEGVISEGVDSYEDFILDIYERNGQELITPWTIIEGVFQDFGKPVIPVGFRDRDGYYFQFRNADVYPKNAPQEIDYIENREYGRIGFESSKDNVEKIVHRRDNRFVLATNLHLFEDSDWLGSNFESLPKKLRAKYRKLCNFVPSTNRNYAWYIETERRLKEEDPKEHSYIRYRKIKDLYADARVEKSKMLVKFDKELANYFETLLNESN